MIENSFVNVDNQNTKRLLEVNNIFLETVKENVDMELIVGSLAWGRKNAVNSRSDLDIVIVYTIDRLEALLKSKYLIDKFDYLKVCQMFKRREIDFLVAKIEIEGVLISIDLLERKYFEYICSIELTTQNEGIVAWKYGKEPQYNEYCIKGFRNQSKIVKKVSEELNDGYKIKLPLFHIFQDENGKLEYYYGIPTIKLLTSVIFFTKRQDYSSYLNLLLEQIVSRMRDEAARNSSIQYNLLHLFVFRERMDKDIEKLYDVRPE